LFHFSEDFSIDRFEPRPVKTPAPRKPGREWLNGPLVWAIDEWHAPMYLFPRDCPRILLWPLASTSDADRERFIEPGARIVAYVEQRWLPALSAARLCRYELPTESFEPLDDAGMWVSRSAVRPAAAEALSDLPQQLAERGVVLKALDTLTTLRDVWDTTLHASGIRLRNAQGW
jgi:hypothetical protein